MEEKIHFHMDNKDIAELLTSPSEWTQSIIKVAI